MKIAVATLHCNFHAKPFGHENADIMRIGLEGKIEGR
jgi:hypothetical protein